MAVRVKVKIESLKGNRGKINTVALVNAGYESDDPEIVLPSRLAEKLGLWPELPEGSRVEEYGSVVGLTRLYWIPECVRVRIMTEDIAGNPTKSHVVISDFEREVLLSDKLAGNFSIVIEDIGRAIGDFQMRKRSEKVRSELNGNHHETDCES